MSRASSPVLMNTMFRKIDFLSTTNPAVGVSVTADASMMNSVHVGTNRGMGVVFLIKVKCPYCSQTLVTTFATNRLWRYRQSRFVPVTVQHGPGCVGDSFTAIATHDSVLFQYSTILFLLLYGGDTASACQLFGSHSGCSA